MFEVLKEMQLKKVTIFAPATIANFGPGFDVFGAALESIGDTITAETLPDEKSEITISHVHGEVSKEADKNSAGISAKAALKILEDKYKIKTSSVSLSIIKGIPQGGLGGSAASAVAGAFAVNELFGSRLTRQEIILASVEGEKAVSGYHLDNIIPCLYGGFLYIKSYEPIKFSKYNPPKNLLCVIANPMIMGYLTKDARRNIPKKEVVLKTNKKHLVEILKGLKLGSVKIIGKNIIDEVVEPIRANHIPGFYDVKNSALNAGAYGSSISGSGPSVFAVTDSTEKAKRISTEMRKAFRKNGMEKVIVMVSRVGRDGAKVIKFKTSSS